MNPVTYKCFRYPGLVLSKASGLVFRNSTLVVNSDEQVRMIEGSETFKEGQIIRVPAKGGAAGPPPPLDTSGIPEPPSKDVLPPQRPVQPQQPQQPEKKQYPIHKGFGRWELSNGEIVSGKDTALEAEAKLTGTLVGGED